MEFRYRTDDEMKDSGVEWLGKIPREWGIGKIQSYFKVRTEKVSDKEYAPLSVTKQGILPQIEGVAKTDNGDNRKKVLKNDFVINSRADRKKSCGVSEYDGSVSLICHVLEPQKEIDSKYIHHLFRSYDFGEEFFRWGTGIVMDLWSTNIERMKKISIPIHQEQQKIASFLDKKTAEFENIIEKKQSLITKLTEAKKSLISEVVTGKKQVQVIGNKYQVISRTDDEMKDSGVEWLGRIPKEWEVKRVRHIIKEPLKYGANESAELDDETLPRYIRITDFGDNGKLRNETFRSLEYKKAKEYFLENGDILFARSGATVGKTFQFKNYNGKACFAGYLIKASPNKEIIISDFMYSFTKTKNYENWKNSIFMQATIQNIGADKYKELKLCIPNSNEQQLIVDFLDEKTAKIDSTVEKIKLQIEKLKEAKQSLISEAVTGKIEIL